MMKQDSQPFFYAPHRVSSETLPVSRRAFLPLVAGGLCALGLPQASQGQIRVEINSGVFRPIKVAFAPLSGSPNLAQEIGATVKSDLESSGFFTFLNPGSFLESADLNKVPNFSAWQSIQAEVLIVGQVFENARQLQLDFRLWDATIGQSLVGKRLNTNPSGRRRLGHILADVIYSRLTGEGGYFDSRIAFVDESGPRSKRIKRLAIMDQDGANVTYLTDGLDLSITPRFNPVGDQLAYLLFNEGLPNIQILNLKTGVKRSVADPDILTFAPRFSPDGQHLVFSRQDGDNASLFELNIQTGRIIRITGDDGIDTAPCYAPNGRQIVFESDRAGAQQIFIINRDGSGLRRLTRNNGRYSTPVWSPKGDLIAFTRQYKGQFSIGVINPNGSGERLLTSGFHNEGPTFSPNGRVIMFFSERESISSLWRVDISGRNLTQVKTPSSASDPSWSNLLT